MKIKETERKRMGTKTNYFHSISRFVLKKQTYKKEKFSYANTFFFVTLAHLCEKKNTRFTNFKVSPFFFLPGSRLRLPNNSQLACQKFLPKMVLLIYGAWRQRQFIAPDGQKSREFPKMHINGLACLLKEEVF